MNQPKLIKGDKHTDHRGSLYVNNAFDASQIKRMYIIENANIAFIRAWQGHKIEQRWFSAINGSFNIQLIRIDNWENPSTDLQAESFILASDQMDILYVPQGYISSIQSIEKNARLLVMADSFFGEINDEYRYQADYFKG